MLSGNLALIDSFGAVGAEDDESLLDYFLSTPIVARIESGKRMLVLGRKGSGKTALVKYFSNKQTPSAIHVSLRLGQYPWGVHSERRNAGATDIETYAASWRYLIAVKTLSALLVKNKSLILSNEAAIATNFLNRNYETNDVEPKQILTPNKIEFDKSSFGLSLFEALKGELNWKSAESKPNFGLLVDRISDALFKLADKIAGQSSIANVYLHFDELDLGLQTLTDERRSLLTGLAIAVRGIRNYPIGSVRIYPLIYLRTDIWDRIDFSDKNKITDFLTDKIVWNSQSLKQLIDQRVSSKVGAGKGWDDITDGERMRGAQPKWDYLVARTFLRPRDVIAYLNYALKEAEARAYQADLLSKGDIYDARPAYSEYLRNELHEEISPHWPDWEEPLRACSAIATMVIKRDTFDIEYDQRRSPSSKLDASTALESLYGYSVVGYRRGLPSGGTEWIFQYTNPQLRFDALASQIKVHTGLKEYFGLSEKSGD